MDIEQELVSLMIDGLISKLPKNKRDRIEEISKKLEKISSEELNGYPVGLIAYYKTTFNVQKKLESLKESYL